MSVRQDNTDVRVARNGVVLPRDVLVEDAPVTGRSDDENRAFRYRRQKPKINWPRELTRILLALLATLLGFVLIVSCLGLAYMSYKMTGVLKDIGQRNFGDAMQRFDRYNARFTALEDAGHRVLNSEPKIVSGVTKYLWVVQPRGTDDRIVYRWKHDLNYNTVEPMTNPALLLDIALGYISPSDAAVYNFYDADDKLAQALAQGDPRMLSPYRGEGGMRGGPLLAPTPVLPPLVDPQKGRKRTSTAEEEEETAETDPNAPPAESESQANESTDVGDVQDRGGGDDQAGDDNSGDSSDVGGGGDGGGGEEPAPEPPDSDAVPVE